MPRPEGDLRRLPAAMVWSEREGVAFRPFDAETDYLDYVDGKRRREGVRAFLAARGILLPESLTEKKVSDLIGL